MQFDLYVNFEGGIVQRDLDQPTRLDGVTVGPVPPGFVLLPDALQAYRVPAADLAGYVKPGDGRKGRR